LDDTTVLQKFNVSSVEELKETGYILINEDGLRLPQPLQDADISVAEMFLRNPVQISSSDELYDLFDLNRGNPTKYLLTLKSDQMSVQ
jgi:hypothetical protein